MTLLVTAGASALVLSTIAAMPAKRYIWNASGSVPVGLYRLQPASDLSVTQVVAVFISGQKRGVTPAIKRQLHRRSAVEPVIGHLKQEHRMGRNHLWYRRGDQPTPSSPPLATTSAA